MTNKADKIRDLEGTSLTRETYEVQPRIILDLNGYHWLMERMRPGP